MPGSFDGGGQPPLVPGAISGYAPGHDLPSVSDKPSQQLLVLVVDLVDFVLTETTGLSLSAFKPDPHVLVSTLLYSLLRNQRIALFESLILCRGGAGLLILPGLLCLAFGQEERLKKQPGSFDR